MASPAPASPVSAPRRRRGRGIGDVPLIWVAAGPDLTPGQTGLWERDVRHPRSGREEPTDIGGEVTVVQGGPPVQVARTTLVMTKLANGDIVELNEAEAEEALSVYDDVLAAKRERNTAARQANRERQRQSNDDLSIAQARAAAIVEVAATNERVKELEAQLASSSDEQKTLKAEIKELQKQADEIRASAEPAPADSGTKTVTEGEAVDAVNTPVAPGSGTTGATDTTGASPDTSDAATTDTPTRGASRQSKPKGSTESSPE
jgi:hypothetical protein